MKKLILFILLLSFPMTAHSAPIPELNYKAFCSNLAQMSGGSAVVEKGCIDNEVQAKENVNKLQAPDRAVQACLPLLEYSPSYVVYEGCLINEIEAIKALEE